MKVKIIPKNKKLLKSSKVRNYFKYLQKWIEEELENHEWTMLDDGSFILVKKINFVPGPYKIVKGVCE